MQAPTVTVYLISDADISTQHVIIINTLVGTVLLFQIK